MPPVSRVCDDASGKGDGDGVANPRYRIVLCGYEGEHDLPGWRVYRYSASAAYQTTNGGGANAENRHRECLWFSPHCVDNARQASLFEVPS